MERQRLVVRDRAQGVRYLAGATMAQEHRKMMYASLASEPALVDGLGVLLELDFTGVEAITASYAKALVLAFVRAGIAFVDAKYPSELGALNVFPIVTGAGEEVLSELHETAISQRLLCLEALELDEEGVRLGRVLGQPEGSVWETLEMLSRNGPSAAGQMMAVGQHAGISVSGWSNRLADLYRMRLASRTRTGRQITYEAIAKRVVRYG